VSATADAALRQIAVDVLEQMAFVFVDDAEAPFDELLGGAAASAALTVEGAASEELTVSATEGLVREVASGMTGCEPEEVDVSTFARAVVAELANVFGGEWALQRSGGGARGKVGLPRELTIDEAAGRAVRAAEAGAVLALESELGAVVVTLAAA
jgi:hypothetical protein